MFQINDVWEEQRIILNKKEIMNLRREASILLEVVGVAFAFYGIVSNQREGAFMILGALLVFYLIFTWLIRFFSFIVALTKVVF